MLNYIYIIIHTSMFKTIIKAFMLILLLQCGSAFADSAGTKCNYQAGGKLIEGGGFTTCNTDKMLTLRVVFFGKTALTGLDNQEQRYQEIMSNMTPAQLKFAVMARKVVDYSRQTVFNHYLVWSGIAIAFGVFTVLFAYVAHKGIKRYNLIAMVSCAAAFFVYVYSNLGVSISLGTENIKSSAENIITSDLLADYQRGMIEIQNPDDTSTANDNLNLIAKKQLGIAESRYNNLLIKSIVKKRSINMTNTVFYKSTNGGKNRLFSKASDYMKVDGGNYIFEFRNPENPDQIMFTLDPIIIANSNYNTSYIASALKAVGYAETYGNNASIEQATSLSTRLLNELKEGPYKDKQGLYQSAANAAMTEFFTDTRSNVERNTMPDFMSETDEAATLLLNALCSQYDYVRASAKQYIKTKDSNEVLGSSECVDDDYSVMGDAKTSDEYKSEFLLRRAAYVSKYTKDLLAINTDYVNSLQTNESDKVNEEILAGGSVVGITQYKNARDLGAYRASVLTAFNDGSYVTTFESNGHDDYAQTPFFRDVMGFNISYDLPVESFVKEMIGTPAQGIPTLNNTENMVQDALLQNGVGGVQDNDFVRAATIEMKEPHEEFSKMLNSDQHVITSFYKLSAKMLNAANKLVIAAITIDIASAIGQIYSDNKNAAGAATAGINGKPFAATQFDKIMSSVYILLSAFTGLLITIAMWLALLAFMGMFNAVIVTTFVPLMLYLLNEFAGIINVVCLPLIAVTAARPNDNDNFHRLAANMAAIIFSRIFIGPFIVMMYYINFDITDVVLRQTFKLFYSNAGVIFDGNDFMVYIFTFFTMWISFYVITIGSTIIMLETMKKIMQITGLRKHALYIDSAIELIDTLLAVMNIALFGTYDMAKNLYSSSKKR